ncbi:MAG: DNA-processing protein DprA [Candidatus Nanopelagicales bacterium]
MTGGVSGGVTGAAMTVGMPGADREDLLARVALGRLAEPGDPGVGALVREHGSVAALDRVLRRRGQLRARDRVRDAAEADLARVSVLGARVVVPGSTEWPTQLDDLGAATPLLLYQLGAASLRLSALGSVAVVGARAATPYGVRVAQDLGSGLASRGVAVVSGGAFGVDAAAHRGALAVDGPTVCVLACGIDVAYPRAHEALLARIADDGALVSEVPPGVGPLRHRFLSRNRIIAALARGTVVVEAALRSGARNTAGTARDLGRVVMGVPGPVTSAMSAGVHELIREGAVLVGDSDDVLTSMGPLTWGGPVRRGATHPRDGLARRECRVLDAFPARAPVGVEPLATDSGCPVGEVVASLGLLEALGLVVRADDGWTLTPLARTSTSASEAPAP